MHKERLYHRNGCQGKVRSGDFPELFLDSDETYRLALKVLAIGDKDGVAIAHCTHKSIWQRGGLVKSSE